MYIPYQKCIIYLHLDSLDEDLTQSHSSALKEYVDLEYAPNKGRVEFIHLLTSVGAQRAKNMPRIQPAPVLLCPMVAESLLQSTTHPHPYIIALRNAFTEKILASIYSCEKPICVLCSSDLDNTSNAVVLVKNAQKLKMLRKAGGRILCLDGGGMRGLMQAEILAQIQAATGRKIIELFDWIVGTSIGGVIALTLVYGKCFSVKYRPNSFINAQTPSIYFILSFSLLPHFCSLYFQLFLSYKLSLPLGNLHSVHQLKQVVSKMPVEMFGKGLAADVNATEEIMKACLPEDIKMCDVAYPR